MCPCRSHPILGSRSNSTCGIGPQKGADDRQDKKLNLTFHFRTVVIIVYMSCQGCTTCCILASRMRENGENEKMKRKWWENEEMERDSLSTFPHCLFISSLSIDYLCQIVSHFVAIILGRILCEEAPQGVSACALPIYFAQITPGPNPHPQCTYWKRSKKFGLPLP